MFAWRWVVVCAVVAALVGCGPQQDDHGDEHDDHAGHHDHDHAHGPHDGEIVELSGGAKDYHLEWTLNEDTDLVTLYILAENQKDAVAIEAATLTVTSTAAGSDPVTYEFAAVEPTGDPATASQFELADKALVSEIKLTETGDSVKVNVEVPIAAETYTGSLKFVDHSDHNH